MGVCMTDVNDLLRRVLERGEYHADYRHDWAHPSNKEGQ